MENNSLKSIGANPSKVDPSVAVVHPSIYRNIEQNHLLRVKVCGVIGQCTWFGRYDCACFVHTNMNRTFFVWAVATQFIHTTTQLKEPDSTHNILKVFSISWKIEKFCYYFQISHAHGNFATTKSKIDSREIGFGKTFGFVMINLIKFDQRHVSPPEQEKFRGDENDLTQTITISIFDVCGSYPFQVCSASSTTQLLTRSRLQFNYVAPFCVLKFPSISLRVGFCFVFAQ